VSEEFEPQGEPQLGVNRIATSPTATALYGNPLAIIRGAPSAPRISPWAVVVPVTAGNTIRYADPFNRRFTQPQTPGSWTMLVAAKVIATGTVRVFWSTGRPGEGSITTKIIRYRGTAVANMTSDQQHSSGSSDANKDYTATSVDVLPGDSLQLVARFGSDDPAASNGSAYNFRIGTAGEYPWVEGGGSLVMGNSPI
jgi:hypothetical protein